MNYFTEVAKDLVLDWIDYSNCSGRAKVDSVTSPRASTPMPGLAKDIIGKGPMKDILTAFAIGFGLMALTQPAMGQNLEEDCIAFDNATIERKKINGRWKIVDGSNWIMDFGSSSSEAEQSFNIIKNYRYNRLCFVGRPDPSMTYFKTSINMTFIFIVRHAEKQNCPPSQDQQCPLTTEGEARAQTLADLLGNTRLSGVLSTNTVRTIETANNTAQQQGLIVQTYGSPAEVAQRIKANHQGQAVLVVGHSNTVPQIIERFGVNNAPFVGNQFNNLFLVSIAPTGEASLTHLEYEDWRS